MSKRVLIVGGAASTATILGDIQVIEIARRGYDAYELRDPPRPFVGEPFLRKAKPVRDWEQREKKRTKRRRKPCP